jgi:hypothetical protein
MQERKYHRLNIFFLLERICVDRTVKHINANHSSKSALDQNSHVLGPRRCFCSSWSISSEFQTTKIIIYRMIEKHPSIAEAEPAKQVRGAKTKAYLHIAAA